MLAQPDQSCTTWTLCSGDIGTACSSVLGFILISSTHRPLNFGVRFSLKAAIASRLSRLLRQSAMCW